MLQYIYNFAYMNFADFIKVSARAWTIALSVDPLTTRPDQGFLQRLVPAKLIMLKRDTPTFAALGICREGECDAHDGRSET